MPTNPKPSKLDTIIDGLRQRPRLLFAILSALGGEANKLAAAWDENTTPPEEGHSIWRRRLPRGGSAALVLHAHPNDPNQCWHAIVTGTGVTKGFKTVQDAKDFADARLLEKGITLL